MSIRDIIEAARNPLPPIHDPAFRDVMNARRAFDRLFRDPEHVALMEAVCEADDPEPGPIHCQLCGGAGVMSLRDCERCGGSGREPSWQRWKARQDLRDALTAYRKERGL